MTTTVLFYLFAIIILISALKMVFSTNLVHSALFMVVTFIGVASIFLLLYADFLAVVQILVYVGAISVLIVFGVMLTRRGNMNESNLFSKNKLISGIVITALFVVIGRSVFLTNWPTVDIKPDQSTVEQIAVLLLNDYAIPFETAGLLLLVAIVGAIVIGKGAGKAL